MYQAIVFIRTWVYPFSSHSRLYKCIPHHLVDGLEALTWHFSVSTKNRMSKCELIELKDLSVNDPIELAAPASRAAPPVGQPGHFHVVRLVGDNVSIDSPQPHTQDVVTGHDFQPYSNTQLTWCDLCGEFIWGLYKQSLRCHSRYLLNKIVFQIVL